MAQARAQSQAPAAADLAAFIEQIDTLVRARTGEPDPQRELDQLGLLPGRDEAALWEMFEAGQWGVLLAGVARACPRLAAALSSVRLVHAHGGDVRRHGWAHEARQAADGGWQLGFPLALASMQCWWFDGGGQLLRVDAAKLRQTEACGAVWLGSAAAHDCQAGLPMDADAGPMADMPLLLAGVLHRLWALAAAHAEARPMFRRHLADFPAVRLRLVNVMVDVLRADQLALRLAPGVASRSAPLRAAQRRLAQRVRIELQQLCGGSGYMQESPFAAALHWFDWCDRVARQLPLTDAALTPGQQLDIERCVIERLGELGVPAAVCRLAASRAGEWA